MVKARPRALLVALVLVLSATSAEATGVRVTSAEFEGRTLFPTVKWISVEALHAQRETMTIVDVRSNYEYTTLHIKDAVNIPLANKDFSERVKRLRDEMPRPIVFYCNGRSCMKSYEAAAKAHAAGIKDVFAYDAGILEWAQRHPDASVLLDASPIDPNRLLSKETFEQHSLSPTEFESRIDSDTLVLDVRDRYQQEATTLFPAVQRSVPLDNGALKHYVDQARNENKVLLIYDAAGHQIQWLQYFLEAEKVKTYYFMKGGARAYYDSILGELMKKAN